MIKISETSDQNLSKDDIIQDGKYTKTISLFGMKVFSRDNNIKNYVTDKEFGNVKPKNVGFSKQ